MLTNYIVTSYDLEKQITLDAEIVYDSFLADASFFALKQHVIKKYSLNPDNVKKFSFKEYKTHTIDDKIKVSIKPH
jgi:hypothetical protein